MLAGEALRKVAGIHLTTLPALQVFTRSLPFLFQGVPDDGPGRLVIPVIQNTEVGIKLRDGNLHHPVHEVLVAQHRRDARRLDEVSEVTHADVLVIAVDLLHGFAKVFARPTARIIAAALFTVSRYS